MQNNRDGTVSTLFVLPHLRSCCPPVAHDMKIRDEFSLFVADAWKIIVPGIRTDFTQNHLGFRVLSQMSFLVSIPALGATTNTHNEVFVAQKASQLRCFLISRSCLELHVLGWPI